MQSIKWLAVLTAALIITACFFPWVSVGSQNFVVGGFYSSDNSRFGQPGIFHLVFASVCILFLLVNRIWSVRTAFFISAFNIAWAVRNFIVLSACSGGECPEKHTAMYVVLAGSFLLTILISFVKVREQ
jgi:hypothetical protein